MDKDLQVTLRVSAPRRWLGVSLLVSLGVLLLHEGLTDPPASPVWQAMSVTIAVFCLAGAWRMWRATAMGVRLTPEGLVTTQGEVIAAMDSIEGVERGVFALKPTNGFLVRLNAPAPLRWQPGLWWRYGQSVGIGGMTPAAQGRAMADLLASRLAARETRDR